MIECNHCFNITFLTEPGARSIGWRFYNGLSLTGKVLNDVICPECSGRGTPYFLKSTDKLSPPSTD